MNLEDVSTQSEKLDKKSKNAILALIDIKTDSDMDKVLNKLDSMEKSLNTRITAVYWFLGAMTLLMSILKFIS